MLASRTAKFIHPRRKTCNKHATSRDSLYYPFGISDLSRSALAKASGTRSRENTLFEAAARAIPEFQHYGFTAGAPGVQACIEAWLQRARRLHRHSFARSLREMSLRPELIFQRQTELNLACVQ